MCFLWNNNNMKAMPSLCPYDHWSMCVKIMCFCLIWCNRFSINHNVLFLCMTNRFLANHKMLSRKKMNQGLFPYADLLCLWCLGLFPLYFGSWHIMLLQIFGAKNPTAWSTSWGQAYIFFNPFGHVSQSKKNYLYILQIHIHELHQTVTQHMFYLFARETKLFGLPAYSQKRISWFRYTAKHVQSETT